MFLLWTVNHDNGISNFFFPCGVAGVIGPLCPTQVSTTRPLPHYSARSNIQSNRKYCKNLFILGSLVTAPAPHQLPDAIIFLYFQGPESYPSITSHLVPKYLPHHLAHNFTPKHTHKRHFQVFPMPKKSCPYTFTATPHRSSVSLSTTPVAITHPTYYKWNEFGV